MAQYFLTAIANDNLAQGKSILEANAELVNVRNKCGRTPLHYALEHLHAPQYYTLERLYRDIVKLLLAYGADPCVKGEDGITPLHMAAEGDLEVLLN